MSLFESKTFIIINYLFIGLKIGVYLIGDAAEIFETIIRIINDSHDNVSINNKNTLHVASPQKGHSSAIIYLGF